MTLDATAVALIFTAFFLMAFTKGAFGGGFGIIGIPLLALVMDPILAGALIAPVNVLADVLALRYWRPNTWSQPDVLILAPSQIVGVGVGFALISIVSRDAVAIGVAAIAIVFTTYWFAGGRKIKRSRRSILRGGLAGVTSGFTSMVAHAGGPPVAMYLLPLGLTKSAYAGTTFVVFVFVNLVKAGPWIALIDFSQNFALALLIAMPAVILGLELGWRLHNRIDQRQLYNACYILLAIVSIKLLWDGASGLM